MSKNFFIGHQIKIAVLLNESVWQICVSKFRRKARMNHLLNFIYICNDNNKKYL
jgi:hypothetical protein